MTQPSMQRDAPRSNGSRFAIVLACTALSSVALLATPFVAVAAMLHPSSALLPLAAVFAWTAYFVMCAGWIRNRRVARYWSIPGTLAGIACSIAFATMAWPFYITATALGLYLTYFHLSGKPE